MSGNPDKFVEFESINAIKKKTIRGQLRKRAKRYDSDSDNDNKPNEPEKRKKVV